MTRFPEFRPIALDDRDVIQPLLDRHQPQTSELTFTNLYIWRDHYDYVYPTERLISLEGRKLHGKRNHINQFQRACAYRYDILKDQYVSPCLDLAEVWCDLKRCEEDMNLMDE